MSQDSSLQKLQDDNDDLSPFRHIRQRSFTVPNSYRPKMNGSASGSTSKITSMGSCMQENTQFKKNSFPDQTKSFDGKVEKLTENITQMRIRVVSKDGHGILESSANMTERDQGNRDLFIPIRQDISLQKSELSLPPEGRKHSQRMRSLSPNPLSYSSLSPTPQRRRANTYSVGQMSRPANRKDKRLSPFNTPPGSPIRMPRDSRQPSKGSISDISDRHSSADGDDELEDDDDQFFHHRMFRPRSHTCPENREWKRRRLRGLRRPGTPPPVMRRPSTPPPILRQSGTPPDTQGAPSSDFDGSAIRRLSHDLPSMEEEEQSG